MPQLVAQAHAQDVTLEPKTAARRSSLDAARFIASLGTVWIHACADPYYNSPSALGRFAVPFFSCIAGVFLVAAMRGRRAANPAHYIRHRAIRLLIPFLAWSAIYLFVHEAMERTIGTSDPTVVGWWIILSGTNYHLWFLMYLFLATAIFVPVTVWALKSTHRSMFTAGCLIGLGGVLTAFPVPDFQRHLSDHFYFLERVMVRSPAFLWGLALALIIPIHPKDWKSTPLATTFAFAIFMIGVGYYWINGRTPLAANLAGFAWFIVGLGADKFALAHRLAPLAKYSFGIYLIHPMFVALYYKSIAHFLADYAIRTDIPAFLFAAGASCLVTAVLQRFRFTAPLVPA